MGKWAEVLDARTAESGPWQALKPQVEAMVDELNPALKMGVDYDLEKHMIEWKRLDETLHNVIH